MYEKAICEAKHDMSLRNKYIRNYWENHIYNYIHVYVKTKNPLTVTCDATSFRAKKVEVFNSNYTIWKPNGCCR